MGYFVTITNSKFRVNKEHLDDAYKALCALNDRDDIKSGGTFGGDGPTYRDPRPEGMDHHPGKWFSWMPADYPKKYKSAAEILEGLGFALTADAEGNIIGIEYDSKIGNEDHFFEELAPFVEAGSFIEWRGEDGAEWRWFFDGKTAITQTVVEKVWG